MLIAILDGARAWVETTTLDHKHGDLPNPVQNPQKGTR